MAASDVAPTATNRWWAQRYNANNAWIFNGTNRNLNNNNVNNANQVGAVTNLPNTLTMTDEQIFSIMLATMFTTRKNKRYGRDSAEFEANWAPLFVRCMRQLKEREFRVDHNYAFLTSVPKWREIFATSFEGRIADHLLCDTIAPYIERTLHHRTYNNRKGMGSQAAINRVIEDIYEVSEEYTKPCRIIKWDLKGFFPNAVNDEIERCFCGVIDRHRREIEADYGPEMPNFLKWLTMICVHCQPARHCELRTPLRLWEHIPSEKSLFTKAPGIGAPIGRLTSQMGMGLYLNDEVVWLNEECGIRATVFMDDCVMVAPEELHGYTLALMPRLRERLAAKGIRLNEKKFYDQPYQHGVEFLGSHIRPNRIHLNDNTYGRALETVKAYNAISNKMAVLDTFVASVNSYTGLLKNRTDYGRIRKIREAISPEWWSWCFWNEDKQALAYRPHFSPRARLAKKYHIKLKTYQNDKTRNRRAS